MSYKISKSDAEWRAQLTPSNIGFAARRERNRPSPVIITTVTNRAFTVIVCCGAPLFGMPRISSIPAPVGRASGAGGGGEGGHRRGSRFVHAPHRGVGVTAGRIWAMYSTMARPDRPARYCINSAALGNWGQNGRVTR